jgi:hypothetical protein
MFDFVGGRPPGLLLNREEESGRRGHLPATNGKKLVKKQKVRPLHSAWRSSWLNPVASVYSFRLDLTDHV